MQKNLLLALGALVLISGGYLLYKDAPELAKTTGGRDTAFSANFAPRDGEIALDGTLNCLPHKSGKDLAAGECIMGLKSLDGKYFALDTSGMQDARGENLSRVRAIGVFAPANESSSEVGDYEYDGVMKVRAMEAF